MKTFTTECTPRLCHPDERCFTPGTVVSAEINVAAITIDTYHLIPGCGEDLLD